MGLKNQLRNLAEKRSSDFFGVAPVSRFKEAPKFHKPRDILPESKSVLSVGIKIPQGVRKANHRSFSKKGMRDAIFIYQMHGYVTINNKLNKIAYSLANFLENQGFVSTPIPASAPSNRKDLVGIFSNRHAAVAAGQANFGWNTLAITEEAGPRVRWVSVLTSADIPPDPLLKGDICDREDCNKCVEFCPVEAIPDTESVELTMEGKKFVYSNLIKERCRTGGVSGLSTKMAEQKLELPTNPGPDDYLKALDKESSWHKMERIASMCGRCIIECPVGS